MLPWKIRYNLLKIKLITELEYLKYKIKTFFRVKTVGFDEPVSLVAFKLLEKYKLSKFSTGISNYSKNLNTIDLDKAHGASLRINRDNHLSIILNPKEKQLKLVVGENMSCYINEVSKQEIEDEMLQYIQKNEILAGLEIGMEKINNLVIL